METAFTIAGSFLFWYVFFRLGLGRERLVQFVAMLRGKDET